MTRFSHFVLWLSAPLLLCPAARAQTATPPPVPVPVVETPDFPGAVWEPASPTNFQPSNRPSPEHPIDRIVIHDIEGNAISAVRWFQNPQAQASSHYVVDANGRVCQMIKEHDIAWHAGDRVTNARAVGIEHEGFAYRPGFFTTTEYEASASLVRSISMRYAIPRDRTHIIGHFEVPDTANPGHFGGRNGHTDPGPYWDWDYFMTLVRNDARVETIAAPPLSLHPGETKEVVFAMTNTGDDPWPADVKALPNPDLRRSGPVYLGTWENGVRGNTSSKFYGPGWVSPRFVGSAMDGDVAPGSVGRFVIPIRAFATPWDHLGLWFRLFKVPVSPQPPVPFGPMVTVSINIQPWDILSPLPPAVPTGWTEKKLPNETRVFWRNLKAAQSLTSAPVRWQTDLPVEGPWDVYVRCPAGENRVFSAQYRVSGSTDTLSRPVLVNQHAGGGQWQKLGRYQFVKPSGAVPGVRLGAATPEGAAIQGIVELFPNSDAAGVLVAGDVRFVGPFPVEATPHIP